MSKLFTSLRVTLMAFAAFGFLAVVSPGRAAVMTWNVNVTFNGSTYDVSYNLLTDVTDMTVRIYTSATTPVLVKTLNATSNPAITSAQWTAGAHSVALANQVIWNGDKDSGGPAPGGQYFAQITTKGDPVTTMAQIVDPVVGSASTDGRWSYNGSANILSSSLYHNLIYWPTMATSGTNARDGIYVYKPDMSNALVGSSHIYAAGVDNTTQGFSTSTSVLRDGTVAVAGSGLKSGAAGTGGVIEVLNGNASQANTIAQNVAAEFGGAPTNNVYARGSIGFGTSTDAEFFYVSASPRNGFSISTSPDARSDIMYVRFGSTPVAPVTIIPLASLAANCNLIRSIAINRAEDTIWLGGQSSTTALYVQKFVRAAGQPVSDPASWSSAGGFSVSAPTTFTGNTGTNAWVALSPDETILWVSCNNLGANTGSGDGVIKGVNPSTGADIAGQSVASSATTGTGTKPSLNHWPEAIATTGTFDGTTYYNGNIAYATYAGTTSTTARRVGLVAPVDNGSTDITRGPDFSVVTATKVTLLTGPTAAVTYHGATVTWTTDIQSDSILEYGPTSGAYTMVSMPDPVTNHSVTVDNLEQNTLYYYRVTSNAGTLTPAVSAEKTFTTTPLTISDVTAAATDNGVNVTWTTNEPATTLLHYGTASGSLTKQIESTALTTSHTATVAGYKPGTVLYYRPESGYYLTPPLFSVPPSPTLDVEGHVTVPASVIFSNLKINAGADSATISFDTNIAATATMVWGVTTTPTTPVDDTGTATSHTYLITGLAPGTTYYYIPTLAPADASLPARTLPVSAFVTNVLGGAAASVTHASPGDVALSLRANLEAPATGSLFRLAMQGVPAAPVAGPDLPAARHHEGVVVYNGYMYVIGGRSGGGTYYGNVWYNNIDSTGAIGGNGTDTPNPWVTGGTSANSFTGGPNDLPAPRAQINNMCFGYNGFIYVVAGVDVSVATINTVWYAKQNADGSLSLPPGATAVAAGFPWAAATPLPSSKSLGSARVVDGWVLVSGGTIAPTSNANYMARIKPDGSLGTWYVARPINSTHTYQRTIVNNHTVYSVGGQINPGTELTNTEDITSVQPDRDLTPWVRLTNDPAYAASVMDNPGDLPEYSGHWGMAADLVRGKILSVAGRLNTDPNNRNNPATLSAGISYTKLDASGMPGAWVDATAQDFSIVYPQAVIDLDGQAWNGSLYTAGGRITTALGAQALTARIPMVDDGANRVYSGTAESQMIDLGSLTNLKHFTVAGTNVSPGTVEARYRFANTEGNFTDWITPSSLDADISGGARWFQYELVLKGDGTGTPAVSSVTLTTGSFGSAAFTVQPGGASPGLPFAVQPVVTVQDSSGVVLSGYTGPVTIALKPGTGTAGAILSGTLTVNAVAGVATFTDLAIDLAGNGYILTATAGALTLDSAAFSVAPSLYVLADVVSALRVAGGLEPAGSQFSRLNVVTGDTPEVIDIRDALRIARKVKGKDINP